MIKIHALQTGSVKIKAAQRQKAGRGGLGRVLFSREWTEWLPIYAWAIEHPEGLIVVDTGETARTAEPGYFPRWQPYYRLAVRMDVAPDEEVGPQLRSRHLDPDNVATLILTHLHTDHAGGLHHFRHSDILLSQGEFDAAQGFTGKVQGYLPHRWPDWFSPQPVAFQDDPVGPFATSYPVTKAGDVVIVPTPGHTPNHVSVIVKTEDITYFLAGDTSYTAALLRDDIPDGVSPDPATARNTMAKIRQFAQAQPTVYLPTHDPHAANRLRKREPLHNEVV